MQITIVKGKWTVIVLRIKVTDSPERAQNRVICLMPNMYMDYEVMQEMENREFHLLGRIFLEEPNIKTLATINE